MAKRKFVVLVYDISDDRRRSRLHQALLDFGTPVQYSVFECWLTEEELKAMLKRVRRVTRPRLDHVRWYRLCDECARRADSTEAGERTTLDDVIIV